MQAARFNLEKTTLKPENETVYGTSDHLSFLKFYTILQSTASKSGKNPAVEEDNASRSLSKQRERQ